MTTPAKSEILTNATVIWFDATSGEGMVRVDGDDLAIYLHFSAIVGIDKNGYSCPMADDRETLKGISGKRCAVALYQNFYSTRVDECSIPGIGGI